MARLPVYLYASFSVTRRSAPKTSHRLPRPVAPRALFRLPPESSPCVQAEAPGPPFACFPPPPAAAAASRRSSAMATGRVVSIRDQGFGFIARDDAPAPRDLFFHRTAVEADAFDQLRPGQRVRFDEEPDPRDPTRQRAVHVAPVDAEQQD
ncbi:MAG TPA: cold shock domain-containing protein [Thermomicrobiales bacterium]|nr:cold shock domain-containing protein [Thermomicrobiales bacterium]